MKRYAWALAPLAFALTIGCGNLKKKEFLPQYEAYKAENAAKFQTMDTSIASANMRISDLEKADTSLKEAIQDAKEEAMAAAEQGDADTLSAAKSNATELDAALRGELLSAVEAAKKAAVASAATGDEQVRKDVMEALDAAKNSAMETLNQVNSKSSSDISSLRAELNSALAKAKPVQAATVLFASGKAVLTDSAKSDLDKAVSIIKAYPNGTVRVIGHADSSPVLGGRYMTNLELSEARAKAAADYLRSKGVTNKMVVAGRGHFEPAALQSTKEGKQASRRVEVLVVLD
jgi:outer membrane protein OmpA-like peptidoglycan-associated protein